MLTTTASFVGAYEFQSITLIQAMGLKTINTNNLLARSHVRLYQSPLFTMIWFCIYLRIMQIVIASLHCWSVGLLIGEIGITSVVIEDPNMSANSSGLGVVHEKILIPENR